VQSCTDPSTGTSAIYHGVIDDVSTSPAITTRIYSNPDLNYGYPNISWSGLSDGDYQSIISFNHSSVSEFAGFSAFHVNAGLEASDRIEIKQGLSWVNVMTDTLERWGDYSGSQRLYSEPGTVWAVGSFGNQNNGHGTWIAELKSPDIQTGVASIEIDVLSTTVFPNPFAEMIDIEFELAESQILKLELLDLEGKLVKVLLEDKIKAGKNRISFNGSFLSPGTYLMNASSNQSIFFSKKVIKQ
jgi:hypothetical protein